MSDITRVLLVEDDEQVGETIAEFLTMQGLTVELQSTYQGAKAAYAAGQWDVLVTDVDLPDGTGIDLVREKRCPVIVVSGNPRDNQAPALEAGADYFLEKPFALPELYKQICRLSNGQHTK